MDEDKDSCFSTRRPSSVLPLSRPVFSAWRLRFGFGTAGFVYVGPVSFASPAVAAQLPVAVVCSSCTTSSSLALAADCGDRVDAATALGVAASLAAGLATFEVSGLTKGASYRLCSDLDGPGGSKTFGDTGHTVYVTPVTACVACALRPLAQQQLVLNCPGCSGAAAGYNESRLASKQRATHSRHSKNELPQAQHALVA